MRGAMAKHRGGCVTNESRTRDVSTVPFSFDTAGYGCGLFDQYLMCRRPASFDAIVEDNGASKQLASTITELQAINQAGGRWKRGYERQTHALYACSVATRTQKGKAALGDPVAHR